MIRKTSTKAFTWLIPAVFAVHTQAQIPDEGPIVEPSPSSAAQAQAMAASIQAYWTPARMASALPMPTPTVVVDEFSAASEAIQEEPLGPPGYSPGWAPGSGPQPNMREEYILTEDDPYYAMAMGLPDAAPQHGAKPTNPLSGPYGPFQRWTWFGKYLTYPTSTIGKLFFTIPAPSPDAGNYVCSATVINRSTLITAGHCNSDGAGVFATNRLFCPSYNKGGPTGSGAANPAVGCWSVVTSVVSHWWHNNADPDYDYACLITANTNTVTNNKIGNVTGWLGRSWNWSPSQAVLATGYPQGAPFAGYHIIVAASTEWYTHDFTAGAQVSKVIGNDMTGGSSGGSWIIGWGHKNLEYPDTDGSTSTDPGTGVPGAFPWVNGVNSHKRCIVSCQSPPTATNGVFWQEMTSPPFRDGTDNNDMKSVTDICFDHVNNNP